MGILRRDPAVDLDVERPAARHGAQVADFVQRRGDEALAAESGIDRHDQDEVDHVDDGCHQAFRRRRVERDAGLLAERADRLQRAVQVRAGFHMHRDDVRARLGEGFEVGIARRDHQVHVEDLAAMRPQRLHDVRPDGDVGHEVAVHHVDVDPVGAGLVDRAHLLAEPGEIRCENGRRNGKRSGHRRLRLRPPTMPMSQRQRGRDSNAVVCAPYPGRAESAIRIDPAALTPREFMARTDAMVLGAGIVGTSIALHLARRGVHAALVDRRAPGEETSYGNTGVIGSALYPASFPRELTRVLRVALRRAPEANYHWRALPRLLPWLFAFRAASSPRRRAETARLMHPLMSRAVGEHEALLTESGATRYLRKTGLLTLYRTRGSLPELQTELALAAELGVGATFHEGDAARALEPDLAPVFHAAVLWTDSASLSDPLAVTRAYAARFAQLGGLVMR